MAARRYGDELWRLALVGDAPALGRAAHRLLVGEMDYDGHRARAFALALGGDADAALAELAAGRDHDWPFPAAFAADAARVRHLAGDDEGAVRELAARDRLDPGMAELVVRIVRRSPSLRGRALRLVLGGATGWRRVRTAAALASIRG